MIIIDVNKHKGIEGALKAYKGKHNKIGIVKELRERAEFTKPSVKKRTDVLKAIYKEKRNKGLEN